MTYRPIPPHTLLWSFTEEDELEDIIRCKSNLWRYPSVWKIYAVSPFFLNIIWLQMQTTCESFTVWFCAKISI